MEVCGVIQRNGLGTNECTLLSASRTRRDGGFDGSMEVGVRVGSYFRLCAVSSCRSFLWPLSAHLVKPIFQLGDLVIFQERNEQ